MDKGMDNVAGGLVPPTEDPDFDNAPDLRDSGWRRSMRWNMQEIIPGVFLGPYVCAAKGKLDAMRNAGLTHVVCVRSAMEARIIKPNHPEHFQYLEVEMEETETEMVIPKVRQVTGFIDQCLNANGKVLVHCSVGMVSSATLVIGYIMTKFGVPYLKANKYVMSKRGCASVTASPFVGQLEGFETVVTAIKETASSVPRLSSDQFRSIKRTIDELEDGGKTTQPPGPIVCRRVELDGVAVELDEDAVESDEDAMDLN